jgi:predicted HTH transcriptional regulator
MNETQQRIFNYINHLTSSCVLMAPSGDVITNMPVLLTRQQIADKLCLSEKTIERHIDYLLENKYIYRVSIGVSNYIYNTIPINNNSDYICRIKV